MLTVIILNTDEPTVIHLTYDNLRRELMGVENSELIIADSWEAGIKQSRGDYVCFVEPDCLVSSGYFGSNMGLFRKHSYYRKIAMLSSCLGIDNWGNRIYNYRLGRLTSGDEKLSVTTQHVIPDRKKKAQTLYPVQIGYAPGALIRRGALLEALKKVDFNQRDLVRLSMDLSFFMWDTNRRVMVNPNTTYVSTDRSLEIPSVWEPKVPDKVGNVFEQEQI